MEHGMRRFSLARIALSTLLPVSFFFLSSPVFAQVCPAKDGEDAELKDTTVLNEEDVESCNTITVGPNLGVMGPNGFLRLRVGPGGMIVFVPDVSFGVDARLAVAASRGGSARVEKTGQNLCYDPTGTTGTVSCSGTGQDGETQSGVASPAPRFTDNLNGTVTDNLTGLLWLKNANCFGDFNTFRGVLGDAWALESGSCGLTDGSQRGDWRVPNVKELQSLIDLGQVSPALPSDASVFSNVQSNVGTGYWSSTSKAASKGGAWFVEMESGKTQYRGGSFGYSLWPVRGFTGGEASVEATGQTLCYRDWGDPPYTTPCAGTLQDGETQAGVPWPDPRFTDNLNGTVTDNLTGLVWLKNANCAGGGAMRSWAQALSDLSSLQNGSCGLTDGSAVGTWRLPNQKEFQSLVDFSQNDWALPMGHPFTNVQTDWYYWSSTSDLRYPGDAWVISLTSNFGAGITLSARKTHPNHVWAVRGGS